MPLSKAALLLPPEVQDRMLVRIQALARAYHEGYAAHADADPWWDPYGTREAPDPMLSLYWKLGFRDAVLERPACLASHLLEQPL